VRALLTDKEVAHHFGVSIHTLRAGRYRSNFNVPPHIRNGGRVLYWREEVLAWAKANGIEPAGPRQRVQHAP
jgi:DNA-binding transcriptional MerR regulator